MAKKKVTIEHCKDCVYATDFHEKDSNGEFFLCKCKYSTRSRFLLRDACPNYKNKQ